VPECDRRLCPYYCVKEIKHSRKKRATLIPYDTMFLTTKTKEELIMTQLQFTLDFEEIKENLVESDLDEVLKSTLVIILNEYMKKERDDYLKVDPYERSDARKDYRNGFYDRELILSIGSIDLRVPRTRSGEFNTSLFEKYQRKEKSLVLAMLEMVVNGVSTRKVTNVVEKLCGESVSKSMVSSLTDSLQEEIQAWNERKLDKLEYCPYLFFDAMYTKVRDENRIVSKAIYIAKGITDTGKRIILGMKIDSEESYDTWRNFINDLQNRGLRTPRMVISDAHKGIKKAIETELSSATWQRCSVHFKRNVIEKMPKKDTAEIRHDFKKIYNEIHPNEARKLKDEFIKKYENNAKLQKAIKTLEDGFEESIQYMNEPEKRHRYIRSTNSLERVNQEVRAREKVIKIFPNEKSAFRIAGAILMDYEEKQVGKAGIF